MAEPDLSEFLNLSKPRRMICGVVTYLDKLAKADQDKLRAALAERGAITNTAIAAWLTSRGVKASTHTIGNHRRGACSCDG